MRYIILIVSAFLLSTGAFAFSKIVKEESFHSSTVKNIAANSFGGNYTISKYNGDSIIVRVSLECKDFAAYNAFMMKYMVTLTNTSGSLTLRTDKIPSSAGTLIYELFIPNDVPVDISSEKSNVSVKDIKVNLKLNVADGVLFTDNLSGSLTVNTEKMDMDIKAGVLSASITAKNAAVNYCSKGGKLMLNNTSGNNKITLLAFTEVDVQTNSGDIQVLLPKTIDCNLHVATVKKAIMLNMEEVALKGNITSNLLKASMGKGGGEIKLATQSGDLSLSNVALLGK